MKGKELIFITSSILLGLLVAWLQFGRGDSPQVSAEPTASAAGARTAATVPATQAPAQTGQPAQVALQRPSAGRDTAIVDVESLDALGLSSYEQFIDRNDNWDEEEEALQAEIKERAVNDPEQVEWEGFSEDAPPKIRSRIRNPDRRS